MWITKSLPVDYDLCGACKGCPDRSVEPLCRNTCKAWQEHEQRKAAAYEIRKREASPMQRDAYQRRQRKQMLDRKRLGK